MTDPSLSALIDALAAHPQRAALTSLVRASAIDATLGRRADFASRHKLGSGPATGPGHIPEGLTREDADTPYGNVLAVLEHGPERAEERLLLGALLALGVQSDPPASPEASAELGRHLVWLAAHTPCDALTLLDPALGEAAIEIWRGVAAILLEPEAAPPDYGPTEALVAAAALRRSDSEAVRALRFEAALRAVDPAVHALLAPAPNEIGTELLGEREPAPRNAVLTAVLALTLVLFLIGALRLIARYALRFRRPAALRLGPRGLELEHRIELLGQVLRDRATVVPLSNLSRVTREVRYARVGLYAGLAALALGTYFGTDLFVIGVRVPEGSAQFVGLGVLLIVLGLAVDFVLSTAAESARGRCRVVVVLRKGPVLCIGGLDPERADALLAAVAEQSRAAAPEPIEPVAPPPPEAQAQSA